MNEVILLAKAFAKEFEKENFGFLETYNFKIMVDFPPSDWTMEVKELFLLLERVLEKFKE